MEEEIWKDVVGYEGYYQISNLGRVKRLARESVDSMGRNMFYKEIILKTQISHQTGYPYVNLSKNGEVKSETIHTLIADAFIPNPDNLPCVNHIDENRANSVLSNLERCTYSYNNAYGRACAKRKETMRRNSEGKHKIIYQFDLSGNLVATYKGGVTQTEEKLGYLIGDCLTGKSKTAHGYVFSYSKVFSYEKDKPKRHQKYVKLINESGDVLQIYKSVSEAAKAHGFDRHIFSIEAKKCNDNTVIINGLKFIIEKKENEFIPTGHKGPRADLIGNGIKPVYQYGKDGHFIKEYPSVKEAAISMGNGHYAADISSCTNGRLKTAHGYIWSHNKMDYIAPFKNETTKKILQLAFDGSIIRTYNSISDATKAFNGKSTSNIGNCLTGRSKSAYGYIWRYAEEVNQ